MYRTEIEILNELESIEKCLRLVSSQEEAIRSTFLGTKKVWFVGSGSSFCLAKSAAAMLTMRCCLPAFAVAAGDLMLHAQRYLSMLEESVIVFVSRSGMTSEVLRVYDVVAGLPGVRTVSICANEASGLNSKCTLSICAPWAFDESVCQTRTIGSFFSILAMICGILSGDETLKRELLALPGMEADLNKRVIPLAKTIAQRDWRHVVVLSDAETGGLMEEGALAFKEICCINSNFYNLLDVRHGPMVMIDGKTLVFALLEGNGETELSLVRDLSKKTPALITCGPFPEGLPGVEHFAIEGLTDPIAYSLAALYILQHTALQAALKLGQNPDEPKGLSAWIAL